jgi:hypothetical protein
MLVTVSGTVIEASLKQPENAASPILVTELDITSEVSHSQWAKPYILIFVTEFGMETEVI